VCVYIKIIITYTSLSLLLYIILIYTIYNICFTNLKLEFYFIVTVCIAAPIVLLNC